MSLLAGCVHNVTQSLDARAVPIVVKERMPINVALLVIDEDLKQSQVPSFTHSGGHTRRFQANPLKNLKDTLLLTLPQVFQRVTLVRAVPAGGGYAAVLVPKVTDMRWGSSWDFDGIGYKFTIAATLQVLDNKGTTLLAATSERESAGKASGTSS
ncbi:MAG: hypothetical protein ACRELS_01630 [Candidatus Rokuibacteriota bacterium]